jgi:hypothetical protein
VNGLATVLRNTIGNIVTTIGLPDQGTLTGINEITATEIAVNGTTMTRSTTHWGERPTDTQDKSQTESLMRASHLLAILAGDHIIPPINNAPSMGNPNRQRKCTPQEKDQPLKLIENLPLIMERRMMNI